MARSEFSKKTKKAAFVRCGGPDNPRCEGCGRSLLNHPFQFDHDTADGLGGDNSLENCKVLCSGGRATCHGIKTEEQDKPLMQKADNMRDAHLGLTPKKAPWPKMPKFKRPGKDSLPPRPMFIQKAS